METYDFFKCCLYKHISNYGGIRIISDISNLFYYNLFCNEIVDVFNLKNIKDKKRKMDTIVDISDHLKLVYNYKNVPFTETPNNLNPFLSQFLNLNKFLYDISNTEDVDILEKIKRNNEFLTNEIIGNYNLVIKENEKNIKLLNPFNNRKLEKQDYLSGMIGTVLCHCRVDKKLFLYNEDYFDKNADFFKKNNKPIELPSYWDFLNLDELKSTCDTAELIENCDGKGNIRQVYSCKCCSIENK